MNVYESLRVKWVMNGLCVNDPVQEYELASFERKHDVTLASSFRTYLLVVNGMREGTVDENLISFLSFDRICRPENNREVGRHLDLIFADYSVFSHYYLIRIDRNSCSQEIFVADGEREKRMFKAFEEFVDGYLASPKMIANCWA